MSLLTIKRICSNDDDHVEVIHQDYQVSSMPPGEIYIMFPCRGGPPLIAIPDIAEMAYIVSGFLRIGLKGILHPIGRDDLLPLVFAIVEI